MQTENIFHGQIIKYNSRFSLFPGPSIPSSRPLQLWILTKRSGENLIHEVCKNTTNKTPPLMRAYMNSIQALYYLPSLV